TGSGGSSTITGPPGRQATSRSRAGRRTPEPASGTMYQFATEVEPCTKTRRLTDGAAATDRFLAHRGHPQGRGQRAKHSSGPNTCPIRVARQGDGTTLPPVAWDHLPGVSALV